MGKADSSGNFRLIQQHRQALAFWTEQGSEQAAEELDATDWLPEVDNEDNSEHTRTHPSSLMEPVLPLL